MKNPSYDHGYGQLWSDIFVEERKRYKTSVTDLHEHDFYEINLILSGNIRVITGNTSVEGTESKIVLSRPNTPHFVSCKPDVLYSSLYLVFTEQFIKTNDVQCLKLLSVFGENGTTFSLSPEQKDTYEGIIRAINAEDSLVRKKLLVFYLLSHIDEYLKKNTAQRNSIPQHIFEALTYIDSHYMEKIVAQDLADKMYIGRTTLMMQFKKHTGKTLHEYITACRLKNAIKLLLEGKSEFEAATHSGFSDSSALIQCFKREFEMTPMEYIKKL